MLTQTLLARQWLLPIGSRNDNFLNEFLREKVAPWTKGLNQRQIEYYFADGNEEELEWVTNLYNQMNPE